MRFDYKDREAPRVYCKNLSATLMDLPLEDVLTYGSYDYRHANPVLTPFLCDFTKPLFPLYRTPLFYYLS